MNITNSGLPGERQPTGWYQVPAALASEFLPAEYYNPSYAADVPVANVILHDAHAIEVEGSGRGVQHLKPVEAEALCLLGLTRSLNSGFATPADRYQGTQTQLLLDRLVQQEGANLGRALTFRSFRAVGILSEVDDRGYVAALSPYLSRLVKIMTTHGDDSSAQQRLIIARNSIINPTMAGFRLHDTVRFVDGSERQSFGALSNSTAAMFGAIIRNNSIVVDRTPSLVRITTPRPKPALPTPTLASVTEIAVPPSLVPDPEQHEIPSHVAPDLGTMDDIFKAHQDETLAALASLSEEQRRIVCLVRGIGCVPLGAKSAARALRISKNSVVALVEQFEADLRAQLAS